MGEPNLNDLMSGGGLSSLLQNPEIAAKLPRIMEALAPVMAEMRAEQAAAPEHGEAGGATAEAAQNAPPTASVPDLAALLGSGRQDKPHHTDSAKRTALLKALAPYLSDSRREAMDYILKVTALIDILREVM